MKKEYRVLAPFTDPTSLRPGENPFKEFAVTNTLTEAEELVKPWEEWVIFEETYPNEQKTTVHITKVKWQGPSMENVRFERVLHEDPKRKKKFYGWRLMNWPGMKKEDEDE